MRGTHGMIFFLVFISNPGTWPAPPTTSSGGTPPGCRTRTRLRGTYTTPRTGGRWGIDRHMVSNIIDIIFEFIPQGGRVDIRTLFFVSWRGESNFKTCFKKSFLLVFYVALRKELFMFSSLVVQLALPQTIIAHTYNPSRLPIPGPVHGPRPEQPWDHPFPRRRLRQDQGRHGLLRPRQEGGLRLHLRHQDEEPRKGGRGAAAGVHGAKGIDWSGFGVDDVVVVVVVVMMVVELL